MDYWTFARSARLLRSDGVPDYVVDGKLDELRALVAPALSLGAHIRQPPLDVGHLERAQLIFQVEMLRDQRLDLLADRGTARLRRYAIGALLRPRIGFGFGISCALAKLVPSDSAM